MRHKQLEPLDKDQAAALKKSVKSVQEMKNDVSHLIQFEEMRDERDLTKKSAGELMSAFAKALTALQLLLQHSNNIVQQCSIKV